MVSTNSNLVQKSSTEEGECRNSNSQTVFHRQSHFPQIFSMNVATLWLSLETVPLCNLRFLGFIQQETLKCTCKHVRVSNYFALVQDATSAAAMARDKLAERGEKLQVRPLQQLGVVFSLLCSLSKFPLDIVFRGPHCFVGKFPYSIQKVVDFKSCYSILRFLQFLGTQSLNDKTAEMQDGAENFAAMAEQLAKKYEKRKWWEFQRSWQLKCFAIALFFSGRCKFLGCRRKEKEKPNDCNNICNKSEESSTLYKVRGLFPDSGEQNGLLFCFIDHIESVCDSKDLGSFGTGGPLLQVKAFICYLVMLIPSLNLDSGANGVQTGV